MKVLVKAILVSLAVLVVCACSKANDRASTIDPRTGKHAAGWVVANTGGSHPAAFLSVPSACYGCHGKDLKGGISNVSCFSASRNGISCHPGGPSGHPAGWAAPDAHGAAAKALLSGMNGLAHCQVCHGADFAGGTANKSCLNTAGCHGAGIFAAHPAKPWLDIGHNGARTHASTDPSNAAACAVCHTGGANSRRTPAPPAPAGTAPGCFNNTLCHGVEGHAIGWSSYSSHGRAAKAAAGGIVIHGVTSPISSFGECTQCHGAAYDGGSAQQSCVNTCHGVAAPHPARPWRSATGGPTHVDTNTDNAAQCALCHTGGANSTRVPVPGDPVGLTGCFNNTLCHGTVGHPAGWGVPAQHGTAAKGAPTTSTGFASCQPCHGSTFQNGTAPSCLNSLTCHGLTVSAPHPAKPWTGTTSTGTTHTTTDPGNAAICAACHTAGANSSIVPPNPASGPAGCYNNTMCHFHQIPFLAAPGPGIGVHGALAKQDLRVCQGCHGVPGSTSFDGRVLSSGVTTIACSSCHTAAKAHATDWQGSGTYSHRTAQNIANACIICHDVTQGRTAPLPASPSCFSASFTNALGQARTCHSGGPGVAPHPVPYNNHNATARSNFPYCLGCHQVAADVTTQGGKVIPRCLTCHLSDPTVTSTGCTSCHANPPAGASYPNTAGTHATHVAASRVSSMTLSCADCHSGLGLGTVDHLNRARARAAAVLANPVVFSATPIMQAGTGGTPSFAGGATGQCSNTYCHGGRMSGGDTTGTNRAPAWGSTLLPGTLSSAACGLCHGFPPSAASGHPTGITIPAGFPTTASLGTTCSCHPNINQAGNSYANIFVDKSLHINGVLDVSASAPHAVPNYNHQAAGTGAACIACHAIGSATSVYPAAVAGAAPDCRGCHKKAAPGSATGFGACGSCHGSLTATNATTQGRPVGTTFPDRVGYHSGQSDSAHGTAACSVCHNLSVSGTGATVNHGPGNRNANPDVVGPFVNGITTASPPGKGVTIPANSVTCVHGTISAGCSGGGTKTNRW
ncbi:hypothetical protein GMST_28050 [Geomonas silvestris]|uniref:Cytochrome c n=1 Tax=Geomonas silvestris TaxID=2740184 RepID=A0A6V8MKF6_9BACT|nr:CxxxxCH/CxxCH domain-containing protein [Geomonas silvestris]GFO60480.1 hypothetical protein GMST_28050 [Geomonas silvestris]